MYSEALNLIREISGPANITLEGLFSHFATSENIIPGNDRSGSCFLVYSTNSN